MKIVRGGHTGSASVPWEEHFTGTAWMDLVLREPVAGVDGHILTTTVTFTPGVRTHWHRHEGGQLLLVVAGHGWVGTREDGTHAVHAGDVIWAPPGEQHWHGATATTTMTHVAVTLGDTHWHDEVVDVPPSPPAR
jgi:quercetin dioxygenase-like cupin family protein